MIRRWPTLPRATRAVILAAFLAALAAGAVPWSFRWCFVRHVEFTLETRAVGPAWSLEWTPADPQRPTTGYWLDLAPAGDQTPITIRRRLPSYDITSLGLRWHGPAGGAARVTNLRFPTRLVGATRPTQRPEPPVISARGATPGIDGWASLGAPAGELRLPVPDRPRADVLLVWLINIAIIAAGLAAARAWWGFTRAAAECLRRRPPFATPIPTRHPVLAAVAILASIGIPLWMFWWSPMLISGDGIAYVRVASDLIRSPSISHFDGWRLPGYAAMLVPAILAGGDYTRGAGMLHAAVAIATAFVALAALRRRVAGPWPWVGMLATAADPMLVVWQRTLLAECVSTFLAVSLLWILLWWDDRCRSRPGFGAGRLLACAAIGALLGFCTLVRGNFQIALVLVPGAVAWSALGPSGWRRALAAGVVCAAAGWAVLAPFYAHVHRTFGVLALTVGPGWHGGLRDWLNGTADWNQTAVSSFEGVREIGRRIDEGRIQEFIYTDLIADSPVYPVAPGTRRERARDIRCGVAFRESRDRYPDRFVELVPKAFLSLLGFPISSPSYFQGFTFTLVRDLLGDPWVYATNIHFPHEIFPVSLRETVFRAQRPLSTAGDPNAALLGGAWKAARVVRPFISVLFLIAAASALRARDPALSIMSAVILAHMIALPVLYYAGGDRYIMPWWGVSTLVVILAFGRVARLDSPNQ